ncbi:MAG TPA: bifunctional diaminohydroxyphosphoribosylaminopyrimidine deaminase/5-amino-6-(5-phosphoribosylamino)uracil reductase RibD [Opitutaceae bacterium]|nr:bifunctional diaminohydroxyphosphoribosylaminopyrimidine deaminase/5-amino-6-(5-phosphoribosylamino)uracil reductase RibD [Opitutaceae bacterium]
MSAGHPSPNSAPSADVSTNASASSSPGATATAADEHFMRRALELARRGWGTTHPNPMVGAVIVEDGVIVAEGFHKKDGGPHAERAALAALGRAPKPGATMYVTLEPCSTHGRTGACTDAICAAKISRVVIAATDPNPQHAGNGIDILRAAGVEVVTGLLERESNDLNLLYNHWVTKQTPLCAAKSAVTLDGKIATRTGESKWITGPAARADVMNWRRLFPSIAVGAGTVIRDNPKLTSRLGEDDEWCPVRFVFDGLLRTVSDRALPQVYTDRYRENTIVVTTSHGGLGYVRKLKDLGVRVWCLQSPTQRVQLAEFRERCAAEKITGVYIEGGSQIVSEFLQEKQIDYFFIYRAPILLSDEKAKSAYAGLRTEKLDQAIRLTDVHHAAFGDDQLIRGRVVYPEKVNIDEALFGLR